LSSKNDTLHPIGAIPAPVALHLVNALTAFDGYRDKHDKEIERIGELLYDDPDKPRKESVLGQMLNARSIEFPNPVEDYSHFTGYEPRANPIAASTGNATQVLDPKYEAFLAKLRELTLHVIIPDIKDLIKASLPHPAVFQAFYEILAYASSMTISRDEYYKTSVNERLYDSETESFYHKPRSLSGDIVNCGGKERLRIIKVGLLDEIEKNGTIFSYPIMEGQTEPPERHLAADSPEMAAFLGRLGVLEAFKDQVALQEYEIVSQAREDGLSWDKIGTGLGMTRQAAHARFTEKGYQTQMANNQKKLKANKTRRIK